MLLYDTLSFNYYMLHFSECAAFLLKVDYAGPIRLELIEFGQTGFFTVLFGTVYVPFV